MSYTFPVEISSSALNFKINQSPENGSCSISPLNGSTTTLFTIACSGWADEDGIKDYSIYSKFFFSRPGVTNEFCYSLGRSKDPSRSMMMVAFSSTSDFQIRLSPKSDNETKLNLILNIRDTLDCVTSVNLSSLTVTTDMNSLNEFIGTIQSSASLSTNPSVQLLASGNQNVVGQLVTSFSQQLNRMHSQQLDTARSSE